MSVNTFIGTCRSIRKLLFKATDNGLSARRRDKALTKAAKHMVRAYHGVPYPFSISHP